MHWECCLSGAHYHFPASPSPPSLPILSPSYLILFLPIFTIIIIGSEELLHKCERVATLGMFCWLLEGSQGPYNPPFSWLCTCPYKKPVSWISLPPPFVSVHPYNRPFSWFCTSTIYVSLQKASFLNCISTIDVSIPTIDHFLDCALLLFMCPYKKKKTVSWIAFLPLISVHPYNRPFAWFCTSPIYVSLQNASFMNCTSTIGKCPSLQHRRFSWSCTFPICVPTKSQFPELHFHHWCVHPFNRPFAWLCTSPIMCPYKKPVSWIALPPFILSVHPYNRPVAWLCTLPIMCPYKKSVSWIALPPLILSVHPYNIAHFLDSALPPLISSLECSKKAYEVSKSGISLLFSCHCYNSQWTSKILVKLSLNDLHERLCVEFTSCQILCMLTHPASSECYLLTLLVSTD